MAPTGVNLSSAQSDQSARTLLLREHHNAREAPRQVGEAVQIAVMGSGGLGGYFGGRLALAGQDVTFLARGEHLRAMRQSGLRVRSYHGDFEIRPVRCTDDPARFGPVDVVIFSVKAWDTETAGRALLPLMTGAVAGISFQNGVDNEERLAAILGSEHVMGGVAYVTSAVVEPGVVEQTSPVARLIFGELDGRQSKRATAFHAACQQAGIDVTLSEDIHRELWTKAVFICAFGGICALTRTSIGPVLNDEDNRCLFIGCMREVEAVARARGVKLDPQVVERHLALAESFGPDLKPSMLHDLERGNRLEVEWLNGAVARMGAELEIDTSVNRFIATALNLHALGSRG